MSDESTSVHLFSTREDALLHFSFLPERKSLPIYCQRTGVMIGNLEYLQQAGKVPYLSHWKDACAYHPLFSLSTRDLLRWTRKNWNWLFRGASDSVTYIQKQQFQIAFVAVLHTFGSIEQSVPALPEFETVERHIQRLIELAYWHYTLQSQRFKFPKWRISAVNTNGTLNNVDAYLDICQVTKETWEGSREALVDESEKLEAARRAEKAVRSSHIKAVSKRHLWNYFRSSLHEKIGTKVYESEKWIEKRERMEKLFLGSESTQLKFDRFDVDEMEEVMLSVCQLGSSTTHAFTIELDKIRKNIIAHQETFTFNIREMMKPKVQRVDADGNAISIAINEPPVAGPAPKLSDFYKRSDFLKAEAKWNIRKMQREAWEQEQREMIDNEAEANEDSEDDIEDDDSTDLGDIE